MNNPDTPRIELGPTDNLELSAASAESTALASPGLRSRREEYTDSESGFPQTAENRSAARPSLPLEVASARFGAAAFACGLLPLLLWATGTLGTIAAIAFSVVSAVGAVRYVLADPSIRTAGFVGFQMAVVSIAVALEFGVVAGAGLGFFAVPAAMLAVSSAFGRLRQNAPEAADVAVPERSAAEAAVPRKRPILRVIQGRSQARSA